MAASAAVQGEGGFFSRMVADLKRLGGSPRELWIVYGVKFLESMAYFAIYNLIAVFLSEDLHMTDVQAGTVAGVWLTAVSVATFFSGFVADSLGIRKSLLVSIVSCLVGRMMLLTGVLPIAMTGLAVMTWGVASMMPTMTAAVRQYTRKDTVSFGFSLFYVLMNAGALFAPLSIGYFRRAFAGGRDLGGFHLSSSQLVFSVGVVATALAVALVSTMRPDAVVAAESDPDAMPATREPPWKAFGAVVRESTFWRFMLFVSLLVLVRLIFQHAHLTWPKYTMREFGRDFPFGTYWAINPAMIIVLTPVVTALTRHRSAYWSIALGAAVSAGSVFFMAASTTVAASVAFIVTLSLGEALWSPRLYEYTATIARPGREATYMGLSQLPMFLAKPLVGGLSGWMLATWCPETGPRTSQMLWLVVGVTTAIGPIAILGLRKVIEGPSRTEREAEAEAAAA